MNAPRITSHQKASPDTMAFSFPWDPPGNVIYAARIILLVLRLETLGQELDDRYEAGPIVGCTPWTGHLLCDGQESYDITIFGLRQGPLMHITNPAMPIAILQESVPFVTPNHLRHAQGGCDEFPASFISLPGRTNCICSKVDGDRPLNLAILLDGNLLIMIGWSMMCSLTVT